MNCALSCTTSNKREVKKKKCKRLTVHRRTKKKCWLFCFILISQRGEGYCGGERGGRGRGFCVDAKTTTSGGFVRRLMWVFDKNFWSSSVVASVVLPQLCNLHFPKKKKSFFGDPRPLFFWYECSSHICSTEEDGKKQRRKYYKMTLSLSCLVTLKEKK